MFIVKKNYTILLGLFSLTELFYSCLFYCTLLHPYIISFLAHLTFLFYFILLYCILFANRGHKARGGSHCKCVNALICCPVFVMICVLCHFPSCKVDPKTNFQVSGEFFQTTASRYCFTAHGYIKVITLNEQY